VLREVFGIDDRQALTAAVLHDTVEDTTTDFDDLEEKFGADVAAWVAMLSKDKRRQEQDREAAYVAQLASAPWQVKVCKLADVFDNLLDAKHLKPEQRERTGRRTRRYIDAIGAALPAEAQPAYDTVERLFAELYPAKS
jgi:guanosine-3',5'-bis(diphosphate) 3'-pyrophosphohydrolase